LFTTIMRPYVASSDPAVDSRFLYVANPVELTFSRPMDHGALTGALTIIPALANQTHEWHDNTLTIRGFFQPRTAYRIELGMNAPDAEYGITLAEPVVWTFTTTLQYPHLSILERGRIVTLGGDAAHIVPTQLTNVSRIDARVYALAPEEFNANAAAPFETWFEFQPQFPPLASWSVPTEAVLDQYTLAGIPLPPLAPGTYVLQLSAPEGVSDIKLLLIE
jgi:hypothetical protein